MHIRGGFEIALRFYSRTKLRADLLPGWDSRLDLRTYVASLPISPARTTTKVDYHGHRSRL